MVCHHSKLKIGNITIAHPTRARSLSSIPMRLFFLYILRTSVLSGVHNTRLFPRIKKCRRGSRMMLASALMKPFFELNLHDKDKRWTHAIGYIYTPADQGYINSMAGGKWDEQVVPLVGWCMFLFTLSTISLWFFIRLIVALFFWMFSARLANVVQNWVHLAEEVEKLKVKGKTHFDDLCWAKEAKRISELKVKDAERAIEVDLKHIWKKRISRQRKRQPSPCLWFRCRLWGRCWGHVKGSWAEGDRARGSACRCWEARQNWGVVVQRFAADQGPWGLRQWGGKKGSQDG